MITNLWAYVLLWWAAGYLGFVFWWTKDEDLHLFEAVLGIFIGVAGPFTHLFGWIIHGDHEWSELTVLLKKRRRKNERSN